MKPITQFVRSMTTWIILSLNDSNTSIRYHSKWPILSQTNAAGCQLPLTWKPWMILKHKIKKLRNFSVRVLLSLLMQRCACGCMGLKAVSCYAVTSLSPHFHVYVFCSLLFEKLNDVYCTTAYGSPSFRIVTYFVCILTCILTCLHL